jgi:FkbM family methyltransferase
MKTSVAGRLMPALGPTDYVSILSGPLAGVKWVANSHLHSCALGTYEPETQSALATLLEPGSTFWDIGACCGYMTILAARCVGTAGTVVAIEPNPNAVAYIEQHVRLNELRNVTVLNVAVSDRPGVGRFETRDHLGLCRLSDDGDLDVETVTLDALLDRFGPPAVVKIDTEGAETAVLAGAPRLLSHAPAILLSTHGRANYDRCQQLLAPSFRLEEIRAQPSAGRFDHLGELLAVPA